MFAELWIYLSIYILSWPFLVVLFILGVVFEHTESHKGAVLTGVAAALVSYYYFDVELVKILEWAVAYVLIGVVWSFWRYRSFVVRESEKIRKNRSELFGRGIDKYYTYDAERDVARLSPGENLGLITTWILIWPFSMAEHFLSDILSMINSLVTKVFRGIYAKIYTSYVEDLIIDNVKERPRGE
jgi:hypothetical protein